MKTNIESNDDLCRLRTHILGWGMEKNAEIAAHQLQLIITENRDGQDDAQAPSSGPERLHVTALLVDTARRDLCGAGRVGFAAATK